MILLAQEGVKRAGLVGSGGCEEGVVLLAQEGVKRAWSCWFRRVCRGHSLECVKRVWSCWLRRV